MSSSPPITGKLVFRIRHGRLSSRASSSSVSSATKSDEISCKVSIDGKTATCFSTINDPAQLGPSGKDAVVDVVEYHGGSLVTIHVSLSKQWRHDRFFRILRRSSPIIPKTLAQVAVPLRDALPHAQRVLTRQIADAYEAGASSYSMSATTGKRPSATTASRFWGGPGHAPNDWKEYWPQLHIDLPNGGHLDCSILFVPVVSPEKSLGGFTEMHKAAFLGDSQLVAVLLGPKTSAATVHSRTRDSLALTPLDIAALRGHLEVALELITDSFHLSWGGSYQGPDKRTSLHHAVLGGNPMLVACLADHFGSSVSTSVRREGQVEESRVLVVDVEDENGWTPLMMACERQGMAEAVSRLVEAGASMDLTNKLGDTALLIACSVGNVDCALALLTANVPQNQQAPPGSKASPAKPNKANHAGDRALDRAAGAKSCPELIAALLDACAVPGLRRLDGSTALHVAAAAGFDLNCYELVKWLDKERGAMAQSTSPTLSDFVGSAIAQSMYFVLVRDSHGRLASEVAAQAGHSKLAEWLREVEERETARLQGSNALLGAVGEVQTYDYPANNDDSDDESQEEEKQKS